MPHWVPPAEGAATYSLSYLHAKLQVLRSEGRPRLVPGELLLLLLLSGWHEMLPGVGGPMLAQALHAQGPLRRQAGPDRLPREDGWGLLLGQRGLWRRWRLLLALAEGQGPGAGARKGVTVAHQGSWGILLIQHVVAREAGL